MCRALGSFAVAFSFVMMLVNGISFGITDRTHLDCLRADGGFDGGDGPGRPDCGLVRGSIVFVVCSIGGDMQQDRSTGWRLGTNRTIQFRYQVIGVLVGGFSRSHGETLHGSRTRCSRSTRILTRRSKTRSGRAR